MKHSLIPLYTYLLLAGYGITAHAEPPFGNEVDTDYAAKLWTTMQQARFVGENATISTPYKGQFPHGDFLDTLDGKLRVAKHDGRIIVKRNYGGEGVTKEMVADDPTKYLKAITVMYKREKGYDSDNKDWFWVKYSSDGDILENPNGVPLAGRVAKGNTKEGCIACHRSAPGNDLVYNNDRR